jgi:hypothetical protein
VVYFAVVSEWEDIRAALAAAGIDPTDFGQFVNRVVPGVIEPSTFDQERATPLLIDWLPRVRDARVKEAIVGHLKTRAAKGVAVALLADEFRRAEDDLLRWQIGDTLQTVVTPEQHDVLLALAQDQRYGTSRQMLIDNLWRVKSACAKQVLTRALTDPDVALHAGSALRRLTGNDEAARRLAGLVDHDDERVARAARENLKRAEKALARQRKARSG